MNKELEALEDLYDGYIETDDYVRAKYGYTPDKEKANFEFIKSALERKEKLEKVWEIVKTKEVNTADFRESLLSFNMTYKHYVNNYKNYSWELLTETEFNDIVEMMGEK